MKWLKAWWYRFWNTALHDDWWDEPYKGTGKDGEKHYEDKQ